MKPLVITILLAIFCTELVTAQGWIKRKNAPNSLSFATSSASVGKGFLTGLGTATYAYDTGTLSWTQVATMPGNVRTSPVSGTLNGKVYCGLGMATFWSSSPNAVTHREFYKYDPATNIWSQVATFPGKARWLWANFALNNKFYVTLGKTFLGGPGYCKDTWEYDPSTDAWSLKDSFPGGYRDDATSFSINGMGYVVGGIISATAANELWQYNPATNSWVQKASCPAQDNGGIAFNIGSYGYYLTGNSYLDSPRFYRYDPVNDAWTRLPDFPGPDRNVSASFSIGRSGFVTTGQHVPDPMQSGPVYDLNDLWEYNLDCPADIINDLSVNNFQQLYCGDTITIDSIKAYAVQNSSAAYNWFTSTDGINYTAVAGGNTPQLTNLSLTQTTYYKRIVTLNAKCFDTSYAIKFEIEHYKYPVIDTPSGTSMCFGDTVILQCRNPYSKRWYVNGNWSPDTASIFKASASGNYSVTATNVACQFSSDTITITIHPPTPIPTIHLNATLDSLICDTVAAAYQWYWGVGIPIPGETNNDYYPSDSGDYYVVITDSNGCIAKSAPIHFTLPVNIANVSADMMAVFPNPFVDAIYFNTPGVYTHYRLVSIQGQTVLEGKLLTSQKSIDVSVLDRGYYLLDLYDRQGYCFRYKISKQ